MMVAHGTTLLETLRGDIMPDFFDLMKGTGLNGYDKAKAAAFFGAASSILPDGYTEGQYIECTAETSDIAIPISGEIEYIVKMAFTTPTQAQVMGYALAANAYFGINIDGDIAAEWSLTGGITDKDPTDVNTIHLKFENGVRSELTIEGSEQISYGYPNAIESNYGQYHNFFLNNARDSYTPVPMSLYHATFKDLQGVTLADLYPCTRDSDNAVGLYDVVGGEFYAVTNAVIH